MVDESDGYIHSIKTNKDTLHDGKTVYRLILELMFAPLSLRASVSTQFHTLAYSSPRSSRQQVEDNENGKNCDIWFFTREYAPNRTIHPSELLSHQHNHGVDNTGNVRVWPSEEILLSFLLQSFEKEEEEEEERMVLSSLLNRLTHQSFRLLELGAGMTGLVGLGLGLKGYCDCVLLTDGNEDCVRNLEVCVAMNELQFGTQKGEKTNEGSRIKTRLLRWNDSEQQIRDTLCAFESLNCNSLFDVIIVSDCLFFEAFHLDLIRLLLLLLIPPSSSSPSLNTDKPLSPCAMLLQPERGGSLTRFLILLEKEAPCLSFSLFDSFSSEVDTYFAPYEHDTHFIETHKPKLLIIQPK